MRTATFLLIFLDYSPSCWSVAGAELDQVRLYTARSQELAFRETDLRLVRFAYL